MLNKIIMDCAITCLEFKIEVNSVKLNANINGLNDTKSANRCGPGRRRCSRGRQATNFPFDKWAVAVRTYGDSRQVK